MLRSFFLTHAFPFVFGLSIGLSAAFIVETTELGEERPFAIDSPVIVSGGALASCNGKSTEDPNSLSKSSSAMKILVKPKPAYTDEARQNNVQGKVVLRVVFLASGNIGLVEPISGLPNGLTEQAVDAAKRIRFEPAIVHGKAASTIKTMEYSFAIY